jgi:hypothetical protein
MVLEQIQAVSDVAAGEQTVLFGIVDANSLVE